MDLSTKIAVRYIFAKNKINFISIITFISIVGISVGVAALIVVMSIFNGFRQISEEQLLAFDPHIRLLPKKSLYIENYQHINEKLRFISDIKVFSPVLENKVVISKNNNIQVVNLVSYLNNRYLNEFKDNLYLKINSTTSSSNVVTGGVLASKLNLKIGDTLYITSTKMIENSLQTMRLPTSTTAINTGIFTANVKDYDLMLAFTDTNTIKKTLLPVKNNTEKISYIDVILNKNTELEFVKNKLISTLKDNALDILTWIDLNKDLYYVMQFERLAVFSILGLILLIAIFNVFVSLAMSVIEKKQNIAILKAIGATNKFIRNIYIKEGVIVGSLGTLSGVILGIFIIFVQNKFHIFTIDTNKYIIGAIPMVMNFAEIIAVCFFSILLATISTILPARKAAGVLIPQVIINE